MGDRVWRRLLQVDPALTERHITHLVNSDPARPLPAAKYLLALSRRAARGDYTPLEGKSPYQLFVDFLELVENFAEDVGLDADGTDAAETAAAEAAEDAPETIAEEPASVNGKLIRFEGAPVPLQEHLQKQKQQQQQTIQAKDSTPYDPSTDPANPTPLNIERIVKADGLEVYKDQAGRLWTGLATYWIKRGEFDKATATFEEGITSVVTIRDFTQIFDAYAEFSETLMSSLMTAVSNPDEDDEDLEETEAELDQRMKDFEELMDRRPFLVNDVLLRRNPNEVVEWEKRVALHGDDDEKVVETYNRAIETINPRKAVGPLHPIYVNFAKFYEVGGSIDPETGKHRNAADINAARKIFEKAIRVPYKTIDELAEVWCEWAEMELRGENYEEAIRLMQRATTLPRNTKVSYHDESLSVQARLFKSLKLWSFYVDLEESIGSVESTKAVYDKILDLKIANAQVIVNYAQFLEDNKYFEESFKIYERGIELFNFPIAFELWNIYLSKFVQRYKGSKLERTRDLFEQALEKCPEKLCKPLFLMYAQLEEEYGLAKRAMGIYERAASSVQSKDQFEVRRPAMEVRNVFANPYRRCTQFTSPKQRKTLACLPRDPSINAPSRSFPTSKQRKCVCALRLSSASWAKSIALAPSTLTPRNSATRGRIPSFGRNGTALKSTLVPRTRSGRCFVSSGRFRPLSIRKPVILQLKPRLPPRRQVAPITQVQRRLRLRTPRIQWQPSRELRVVKAEHQCLCNQARERHPLRKRQSRSSIPMLSTWTTWMTMMSREHQDVII